MNDLFTDPDIQKKIKIQFHEKYNFMKILEKYNFRTTFLILLLCFYVLVKTNVLQKKQNHSKSFSSFFLVNYPFNHSPSLNTNICFSLSPLSLSASANLVSCLLFPLSPFILLLPSAVASLSV